MRQAPDSVEQCIKRWEGHEGGAERANYGMYLSELCDVLGVPRPDPAQATTAENDYVFERAVKLTGPDGSMRTGWIDLYKRGAFVLEAKQSRLKGGSKALDTQGSLFSDADMSEPNTGKRKPGAQGREAAASNVMMMGGTPVIPTAGARVIAAERCGGRAKWRSRRAGGALYSIYRERTGLRSALTRRDRQ